MSASAPVADQPVPVISIPNGPDEVGEEDMCVPSVAENKVKKQSRTESQEEKVTQEKGRVTVKRKKAVVGTKSPQKTSSKPTKTSPEITCNLTVSDLTPAEIHVIKSIGKIKRQKQRASFDRIANILKQLKNEFPVFESSESVKEVLHACLDRGLLQETYSDAGVLSYKEMGPGIAIVAQIARRKNAATLAATYNVHMSFLPDPEETPATAVVAAPKERVVRSNKKKRKETAVPETRADDQETENHVDSTLDAVVAAAQDSAEAVVKVCGLCRADGSHNNTLITCSACGLSGECPALSQSLSPSPPTSRSSLSHSHCLPPPPVPQVTHPVSRASRSCSSA